MASGGTTPEVPGHRWERPATPLLSAFWPGAPLPSKPAHPRPSQHVQGQGRPPDSHSRKYFNNGFLLRGNVCTDHGFLLSHPVILNQCNCSLKMWQQLCRQRSSLKVQSMTPPPHPYSFQLAGVSRLQPETQVQWRETAHKCLLGQWGYR